MSALTNAILANYPGLCGHAQRPVETVYVRGVVTRTSDPMYVTDPSKRAIVKRLPVEELPVTVVRWLALGRRITSVSEQF